MAARLPVLTSDAGGVRENLRHGLNGLLLPRGNAAAFAKAIVGLSRETGQRDAIAAAARAFAVGRDWNRELVRLPTLYAEAMLASSLASPARSLLADRPIT
jgi:glycosyltransferase involved in cell wall biosynthesis